MSKTDFPARISCVMDTLALNQSELAKKAGASKSMVSQWLSGLIKSISPKYAFNLQRTTGYSAEWLMTGDGPERITYGSNRLANDAIVREPKPPYQPADATMNHAGWPFSQNLLARIQSLSEYQRGIIEGRLRSAVDELDDELDHGQTRSANGKR